MRLNVRIHPVGAVLLAVCFLFAPSHAVLAAIVALAWHELAHVAAMALCGVKRCALELTPFGGMADAACYERLSPGKKAVVALSGILASAFGAWLCLCFAPAEPFWHAFYLASASLAVFNCLPVWPLDGAQAVLALAEKMGVERTLQKALTWLAYALGAFMVALGLYGAWLGHINLSLLCAGPYLAYAAHECAITQTVKRMQRAQDASRKLDGDRIVPMQAFACAKDPSAMALARLTDRLPYQRYHVLLVIDQETGQVKEAITETGMAQRLFHQNADK